MVNVSEWWKTWQKARSPWLVYGTDSTLARRGEFDTAPYTTLTLDDAISTVTPDVACFLNTAALKNGEQAARNGAVILVPNRLPSTAGANDSVPATEVISALPEVKKADGENRVVTFDLPLGAGNPDAAQIMTLLATQGAKTIRTLGIDFYSIDAATTAAANAVASVIQKYKLESGSLTVESPARLFIGSDPSQELGAKILEYSVRKHSTVSSTFDTMGHVEVSMPKDPKNQPRTQFSFNRFAIPALAGYHGRALYVDADMLTFHDLREMYEIPFGDATVLHAPPSDPSRPKQTSVMLLNCDKLRWDVKEVVADLDAGKYDYSGLMRDMLLEPAEAVQEKLPFVWNSLEEYNSETRLIHYTDMKKQPWVSRKNKYEYLWLEYLLAALNDGFITEAELRQAVDEGFVRPSILLEMKMDRAMWSALSPIVGALADIRYKPHRALQQRLSKAKIGIS